MTNYDNQAAALNGICEGWTRIQKGRKEKLYMDHGPEKHSIFRRSRKRIKQFKLSEDDDQEIKDGFGRVSGQMKLAGKRKFDVSKFALLGCLVLLLVHGNYFHGSYKSMQYTHQITVEEAEDFRKGQIKALRGSLEDTEKMINSGKEGLKQRYSKLRKDPDKLEKYWENLHRYQNTY